MANYKHGVYGQIMTAGSRMSQDGFNAIVYIGTAPVHTVAGGGENVNKPILINNIAEAKKKLGYSDDFASYTLCEAMNAHLNLGGIGPIICINVLDPSKHKVAEGESKSLTPVNGTIVIAGAEGIILDTVAVGTKVKGTDYAISYNPDRQTIVIAETSAGSLGTSALTVTYNEIDPSAVDENDVIGTTDGSGLNTGLYAVQNVHQLTGYVPSFLLAPGFSSLPNVHNAMVANSKQINGHWDAYLMVDLPIVDNATAITLASAKEWKDTHGYNKENETVYFPMVSGTDGHKYHLSTLAAANFQQLLAQQDGIPYRTASNTQCAIIENLYLGEASQGRVYDDTLINSKLNANGIASAAFVGGRWVIWGAHSADYDQSNADTINVSETNRMMLYYISNDFQMRRAESVDRALTVNDVLSICAEEQARLDALIQTGALVYGKVHQNASADTMSDLANGDFSFVFDITTTPIARSLTAVVNWTAAGLTTYYNSFVEA